MVESIKAMQYADVSDKSSEGYTYWLKAYSGKKFNFWLQILKANVGCSVLTVLDAEFDACLDRRALV